MAKRYRLEQQQIIPAPRERVFAFFSAAENLERLTPPFLRFRILTPLPIEMHEGRLIEYRIGLGGIPMRWLTRIEEWEPNVRFVDIQLCGPYRHWHHLHEFTDAPGGTTMRDVVDYELPLGPLGAAAHVLLIERLLQRIFAFRAATIAEAFAAGGSGAERATVPAATA